MSHTGPARFRPTHAADHSPPRGGLGRSARTTWIAALLALTLLVGPNSPFLQGIGMGAPVAAAKASLHVDRPNRYDPRSNKEQAMPSVPTGTSANQPAGPPQSLRRTFPMPMRPGTLALAANKDESFTGSDGRLEIRIPAGAVTVADLTAAGGALNLQITQIAPASGSNAGGSGLASFSTYLLQVVDAHGVLAKQGLRKPVTFVYHLAKRASAFDLTKSFAVYNALLPDGTQLAPLTAPAPTPALHPGSQANRPDPADATPSATPTMGTSRFGSFSSAPATFDPKAETLTVSPMISTPSTSMSWNTDSPVAAFGKPDPFNVDLSAGSLSAGYPIDVPSGPGGLTPPISLAYSSAGVSEQHSPQAAAGWVGEGWNLGLGSISWAEHNVTSSCQSTCGSTWESSWQLNDPYGTAAELIPPDINTATYFDDTPNNYCDTGWTPNQPCPIQWHTAPETHAKIYAYVGPLTLPDGYINSGTKAVHPPCFRVFLTNGLMEEFGCTADSLEYYYTPGNGDYISSWNLDLITDPQGNQIHLTYKQDLEQKNVSGTNHQYVRDAVLSAIEWDSPNCRNAQAMCTGSGWAPLARVNFLSTTNPSSGRLTNTPANCNSGANLRCDDPVDLSNTICPAGTTSMGLGVPDVQSVSTLDDVQVQTRTSGTGSWNILRDYQLSYQQNGPTQITDPSSGLCESTAGQLLLTKLVEVGADAAGQNPTALPARTFGYTQVAEYYEDDTFHPNSANGSTNCGPAWNTGNGSGCLLWSTTYQNNSFYLSSADNGLGLHQTFSWDNARNNTHGVNGGGSNNTGPLYCNGLSAAAQATYPCNEADDQNWSHVVLTQQQDAVGQAALSGNTTVTTTTSYSYQLSAATAKECADCVSDMYWGNINDGDYLDYYNAKFMGFAQATESKPDDSATNHDGSVTVHKYYATEGYGVYQSGQACYASMAPVGSCSVAPWWDLTNAAHGHEIETDVYKTDGTTLLAKTTTQYQAICPPSGVSGTPAYTTPPNNWGNWGGNLVSMLDHNNPVAACDIQTTRTDAYTYDGASGTVPQKTTTYAYDTYGRTTSATVSTNGGGGVNASPTTIVTKTAYVWNDSVNAQYGSVTGTYLIEFPAFTDTEDSAGNRYSCDYTSYDGQAYATGQTASLTLGEATTADKYTSCGTSPGFTPSGLIETKTAYDAYGNAVGSKDPDANANISSHVGCTVGTVQYSTCTTFDGTFVTLPTSDTNALNQTSSMGYGLGSPSVTNGYGLWPVSTTDFNGQTTSFAYDALGRMTGETLPGEGAGLTTKAWTYTVWCAATGAQTPCVEEDQTDRIDSATTVVSRAFYDGYGNLVETRKPGPGGQDVVTFAYRDGSGHMVAESNSYFVPTYTGAAGSAAFATPDNSQPTTVTTYDGLQRVVSMTDPGGNPTSTTYAVACAPVSGDTACYERTDVADSLGHKRSTFLDAAGREVYDQRFTGNGSTSAYALYTTSSFGYDYNGNLVKIVHPNGTTTTSSTFDAAGRKTGMTDPDKGTEAYTYDADGNLVQAVDGRAAAGTVYAGYDGLDRLLWRNNTNSTTGAYVTFTYDGTANGNKGVGRKTGESFKGGPNQALSGSYAYTYDARGQQTGQTLTLNGTGYTVSKTFDDNGDITTQTYPDGEVVTNGYTAQGWLLGVTTSLSGVSTTLVNNVAYAGAAGAGGLITSMGLGNGTYTYAASYDLEHRLSAVSLKRASDNVTLFASQPSYDAVGNVTAVATTLPAGTDTQTFCYDEQNRLTWASSASGTAPCGATNTAGTLAAAQYTQSFSYDTLGRLATGPLGSYTYGDSAHVHGATAIGSAWTAKYDAAGNMTCRAPTSATTCAGGTPSGAQLTWDLEGQLAAWQNAPSSPSTTDAFLYDGAGDRVEQQVASGGTTTTTVYVGNIEEVATTGSTTTTTTYYYAGTQRVALAVNGAFSYLGNDLLGSADVALSASGTVQAAQLFGPYGGGRYSSGAMPGSFAYAGQRADNATGLDYDVARYYDPAAGQFTSADNVLPGSGYDPWGLSRYAYVAGNPETRFDADGHCWPFCTMVIGAVIGAAVGAAASVASQWASGQGVNWGEVGKQAAVGAVAGAISGLAGPEAGLAVRAAVDTAASVAGQVASNALNHKPLGDGVGMAALTGLGMSVGLGFAAKGVGAIAGKFLHRGVDAAEGDVAGAMCRLSFAPDTQVATPDGGEQAIGTIKVGDRVAAYDPQTGKPSAQTVQHVWINHDTDLVDITLTSDAQPATTGAASDTKQRDAELAAHGLRAPPAGEARDEQRQRQAPVAGNSAPDAADAKPAPGQAGEVVHTTAKHPWLTADRGFVKGGDLRAGERVVRLDGSTAVVASVRVVPGAADYYNLTVSNLHTFAVGHGRYVVHNCGEVGQVEYGSTKLSAAARDARGRTRGHNFAAAELDDGTIITGVSRGKGSRGIHAEEDLINQANRAKKTIKALYSERAPCSKKCAGLLMDHNPNMKISWSWEWNGVDRASTKAIRARTNRAIRDLF